MPIRRARKKSPLLSISERAAIKAAVSSSFDFSKSLSEMLDTMFSGNKKKKNTKVQVLNKHRLGPKKNKQLELHVRTLDDHLRKVNSKKIPQKNDQYWQKIVDRFIPKSMITNTLYCREKIKSEIIRAMVNRHEKGMYFKRY